MQISLKKAGWSLSSKNIIAFFSIHKTFPSSGRNTYANNLPEISVLWLSSVFLDTLRFGKITHKAVIKRVSKSECITRADFIDNHLRMQEEKSTISFCDFSDYGATILSSMVIHLSALQCVMILSATA
jgi:hypothetical protein